MGYGHLLSLDITPQVFVLLEKKTVATSLSLIPFQMPGTTYKWYKVSAL